MRVDQKSSLSPTASSAAQRRGPTGQRFTLGESGQAKTSSVAPSTPLASVDALLALQGEDEPAERK